MQGRGQVDLEMPFKRTVGRCKTVDIQIKNHLGADPRIKVDGSGILPLKEASLMDDG